MSEAITGVPAANASVSTIPKLAPPSEGALRTSPSCSARHSSARSSKRPPRLGGWAASACVYLPGHVGVGHVGRDLRGIGSDGDKASRDVLDQGRERGDQHGQALALLGPPDEDDAKLLRLGLRP